MKTSFAAVAFSLASVAYSQSISDLPSCSLNCFVTTLGGDGCSSLTDFECHCKVPGLTDEITPCVQKACSADDQKTVAEQVVALCSQYGVSISVPEVSSTAAPSSSAAASAPASSSAAATTSESATESSVAPGTSATSTKTASPSATDVVVSTPVATPTTPTTPTTPSTPGATTPGGATPSPSQFEGAAPTAGVVGGVVGLAVAVAAVAGF